MLSDQTQPCQDCDSRMGHPFSFHLPTLLSHASSVGSRAKTAAEAEPVKRPLVLGIGDDKAPPTLKTTVGLLLHWVAMTVIMVKKISQQPLASNQHVPLERFQEYNETVLERIKEVANLSMAQAVTVADSGFDKGILMNLRYFHAGEWKLNEE